MAAKTLRSPREMTKAIAYYRTSSAANVAGDSEERQRQAVSSFATRAGFEIVAEYYDAAVSGTDPIDQRPGFSELLDRIEGNGVRVVLVEDASRFARDLLTQELGLMLLLKREVQVFASNGDELTNTEDPMKKAMRQIAGAFAELEKARLVSKLRAARERKRAEGKVEGRKALTEVHADLAREAKRLRRASPLTGERRSYRKIAEELEKLGYRTSTGKPYSPSMVKRILET